LKKPRTGLTTALDIGSSKVCCLIADRTDDGGIRVIGIGHQLARGLKNGSIVDMEATRNAVRAAVHAAEEMADVTIRDVVVNVSAGQPRSNAMRAEVTVSSSEVTAVDLRRVLDQGCQWRNGADHHVIHAVPVSYILDDNPGIRDPRGMVADRLGVEMNVVTASISAIRNLISCVSGCHLEVEDLVVSPYAAGLACLNGDEIELGATIVDMGGGTTSIAVFEAGELSFVASVPVGGQHVTADIAHGLSTSLAQAERLKTLHGSATATAQDERRMIEVRQIAEDGAEVPERIARAELIGIIRPRIEETFELVRERLERAGRGRSAAHRIVLTGGASQLPGIRELSASMLGAQTRLGRPGRLAGLADSVSGPAFAVACGLLHYATEPKPRTGATRPPKLGGSAGLMGRIGQWLHDNF
jgi:cell division protein FtsA